MGARISVTTVFCHDMGRLEYENKKRRVRLDWLYYM